MAKGVTPPAWEVRHREWLSHPDGQVEIFELRQDHNSSSHFAIFTAKGEDGGVVEWSNVWEQTLATLPAALKIMSEYVHLSLDSTLCEVGLPFWRCACGEGFWAPRGAVSSKYHTLTLKCDNCFCLGAHKKPCPQQEEPPDSGCAHGPDHCCMEHDWHVVPHRGCILR